MLIAAKNLTKYYGSTCIFENVTFEIDNSDKVGFVGSNGAGKTTLFKVLTNEEYSDGGEVFTGKNVRIGYMHQHPTHSSEGTVFSNMLEVYSDLIKIEQELDDILLSLELEETGRDELIAKHHALSERFKNEGGYVYKSKIRSVLIGLGFNEEDFSTPVSVLSGGQRTRLLLAKLLLQEPELLLLDEPTNHLDIDSTKWLEEYLVSYPGGMIIVSHDRYFLDKVTNRTLELENRKISAYKGNYSKYSILKKERELHETRVYENTMAEVNRLKSVIEQQRRWNREKNIKTAESKQKIIDRLLKELEEPSSEQETIRFSFKPARTSGNDVLSADGISKSFDSKHIFSNANLNIYRGDRIFLLGPNGCGKTTFFKILLGIIDADKGEYKHGVNVDVGYYDQTGASLNNENTIIEEIWNTFPELNHTQVRSACAAFLFKGEDVFKNISELSGGERARVSLIKLMLGGSNFLMLDEPTNHLDIATREILENALLNYNGTFLIISHDRYFINKLATSICVMSESGIKRYDGNYEYYLEKSVSAPVTVSTHTEKKKNSNDFLERKELAKRIRKLENTITKCEQEMDRLGPEIDALNKKLELPEVATDYTKMLEITEKINQLNEEYEQNFLLLEESENLLKELK